jgi:hypothetical protein
MCVTRLKKLSTSLTTATVVIGATLALVGCAAAFGQTDGFPEKLKNGCGTEQDCERLATEADARVSRCQNNTIGYIRCSDAEADRSIARGLLEERKKARQEKEQQAADEQQQRRAEELKKQENERKEAKEKEAAKRQAAVQEKETQREMEAESVWQSIEGDKCSKKGDPAVCAALEEYARSYSDQPHASEARVFARMGREVAQQREESRPVASGNSATKSAQTDTKPKQAKCCDGSVDSKCGCSGGAGCCYRHGGFCSCE